MRDGATLADAPKNRTAFAGNLTKCQEDFFVKQKFLDSFPSTFKSLDFKIGGSWGTSEMAGSG